MCFTFDQIEQACGFLLLGEFNIFVYCCKICRSEYASGPLLEVHILSEHSDDKTNVLGNVNLVDESVSIDSPTEIDPINVKSEPDDNDQSFLIVDDVIQEYNGNNNEINDSIEATIQVNDPKRRRGRPRGSRNKYGVTRVGRPMGSESGGELFTEAQRGSQQFIESSHRQVKIDECIQNASRNRLISNESYGRDDSETNSDYSNINNSRNSNWSNKCLQNQNSNRIQNGNVLHEESIYSDFGHGFHFLICQFRYL